jgi:transposase
MTSIAMRRRLRMQAGIKARRALVAASPFRGPTAKAMAAAEAARAQLRLLMKRRIGWECRMFEGRHDGQGGEYVALIRGDRGNAVLLVASCAGNVMTAGKPMSVANAISMAQKAAR